MRLETHRMSFWAGALTVAVLALSPAALFSQHTPQMTGRFAVWIPDFETEDRAARGFGRDVVMGLRALIDDLGTHRAVEERAVDDALDRLRLNEDDLNCERARSVARAARVAVLVCGSVGPASGDDVYELAASFVTVENGETFNVPGFTASREEVEAASSRIFGTFQTLVEQQRSSQFCAEFALSERWERALENCDKAIELNPMEVSSIYTRGMVHVRLERWDDALRDFESVLGRDPEHGNALKAAGLVSTQLGAAAAALGYYQAFLELNPEDAHVRMNLAYEAATAGDPYSAMVLVDEGLAIDPEHVDLWLQKAGYAMSAAERLFREDDNELSEESARLYRESIAAYEKVLAARPEGANVSHRRNVISAYQRLGEMEMAYRTSEQALQMWPEEAQLWSVQADMLMKMERPEEAIAALDRVHELDPTYPNVLVRRGTWLLEANREDEAVAALGEATARGERPADDIANVFFVSGYREGVRTENWQRAVGRFRHALRFGEGDDVERKVGFWLGYALLKYGQVLEEPQTLETAQRARPVFEEALRRLRASTGYPEIEAAQLQNLVDAARQFLDIQDAIIRRGGR